MMNNSEIIISKQNAEILAKDSSHNEIYVEYSLDNHINIKESLDNQIIVPYDIFLNIIKYLDSTDTTTLKNLRATCRGSYNACEYISKNMLKNYQQTPIYVWRHITDGWGGFYSSEWKATSYKPTEYDMDALGNSKSMLFVVSRIDIMNNHNTSGVKECNCPDCIENKEYDEYNRNLYKETLEREIIKKY